MLIGLSGKKNAGKNTVASMIKNFLIEEFQKKSINREVKIVAFADPIKEIIRRYFGIEVDVKREEKEFCLTKWRHPKTNKFMSIRELLQYVGTDIFRNHWNDFWIRVFEKNIEYDIIKNNICIIPDVRFMNEIEEIKKFGGVVVRIDNNKNNTSDSHLSETALDGWDNYPQQEVGYYKMPPYSLYDYILYNNGSLDDLKDSSRSLAIEIFRGEL